MEAGHAGSPLCSLYTHSPVIFSACCNTAMQICSGDILFTSLHGPPRVTWHFPDDAIWVYFIGWGTSAQTHNRIWLMWGIEWSGSVNKIQTATFTNTLQYLCVSENTCCDCMLLFFLLTSPEEIIMRKSERDIKTFHKMITFQCFSKHFENAFQCSCYT